MKTGWTKMTMGKVLEPIARFEERDELSTYQFAGTFSYARGIFRGDLKSGSSFNLPKIQRIRSGDFIYCKIMAWEGAFGLAGDDVDGCVMSGAFVAYRPNTAYIEPRFLEYWFKCETNWKSVAAGSTGTNVRRKSLHPDSFAKADILIPPMAEQQRIVAHLDAIEERINRIQKVRKGARLEIEALTTSLHLSLARGRQAKLAQLLFLDEEQETIAPDGSYPQVGIRSFGMGMFTKPAVTGSETRYRAFNVLRPGKFVMSQVKGWEGAVCVVDDNLDGWFVSPEYRTFSCISNECDPSYLSFLVATTWFRTLLASATRGVGARRERVRPEKLLALEMPFPTIEEQRSAVKMLKRLDADKHLSSRSSTLEAALIPSILDRVFND